MFFTTTFLCLLSLSFFNTVWTSQLTVLETTSSLAAPLTQSGARLANSSTLGHEKVTVCARFLNYQFSSPVQSLLGWNKTSVGSVWQGHELTGVGAFGDWFSFPVWDMQVWNHICIMLDSASSNLKVVLNGETVTNRDLKSDLKNMDSNLSLFGYPTMSFLGQITDVNMWSRSLSEKWWPGHCV